MIKVRVQGLASQKIVAEFELKEEELEEDFLTILRSRGIPIASTCIGEGVCQKCVINDGLLSCMTKPTELIVRNSNVIEVTVGYL